VQILLEGVQNRLQAAQIGLQPVQTRFSRVAQAF
jgi:hypothetical protein